MSSVTAETIELYQQLIPSISCGIAVAALLLYDALLCIDREWRLIWRKPRSVASALYFVNRYLPIVWNVLPLFTIYVVSDKVCPALIWSEIVVSCVSLLGPAVFAFLRMYALSGKSKVLSGVTLVLSLAPFLVTISVVYRESITEALVSLTLASRTSLVLANLLVVAVTWRTTLRSVQMLRDALQQPSLHQVLLQSGSIYFCTLTALYTLDVALEARQISSAGSGGSYVTVFLDPLASILNSRFLLDLRETDERLVAGGSSVSQGTVEFAGVDVLSGQLPSFLEPADDPPE
ncbi:hypothetical protein OH77DRAFT_968479 [Trametes cingulata]|nr:hypothetical protein OH77DRAFT_968479 [Trametes cingulata]